MLKNKKKWLKHESNVLIFPTFIRKATISADGSYILDDWLFDWRTYRNLIFQTWIIFGNALCIFACPVYGASYFYLHLIQMTTIIFCHDV